MVHYLYPEPGNPLVSFQELGSPPHNILNEGWIVVSLHRHVSFIGAFEQWVYRGRRRGFSILHQVFNSDDRRRSFIRPGRANIHGHIPSLVMSAVIADLLAARTKAGDRDPHPENEVLLVLVLPALENKERSSRSGRGWL